MAAPALGQDRQSEGGYNTGSGLSVSKYRLTAGDLYSQADITTGGSIDWTSGMFVTRQLAVEFVHNTPLPALHVGALDQPRYGIGVRVRPHRFVDVKVTGRWRAASQAQCGVMLFACIDLEDSGPDRFRMTGGISLRLPDRSAPASNAVRQ
jgi:hypothetical protein